MNSKKVRGPLKETILTKPVRYCMGSIIEYLPTYSYIKFRYCEKATKISHIFQNYLVSSKLLGDFFSNICGLLRISELYVPLELWILKQYVKVHIFWEGHKILRNLHCSFVLCSNGQIYGGDFAKFCGLLWIYELYS